MSVCRSGILLWTALACAITAVGQAPGSSQSSSSKQTKGSPARLVADIDADAVTNGVYRNKALGLTCKIPEGWVLRTEEINAREPEPADETQNSSAKPAASSAGAKVLLAAFSRPPEAKGEEVNSSILIAAESQASYPGLKEAVQYFGPLTEVAKAQGFSEDDEPYEIALDNKTLVRADFHKDVGTRVMRQSTLAMLSHGYAVSITVIAGTEDDVEELIDGVSFAAKK